jgi:excisionase family DNA binding protein
MSEQSKRLQSIRANKMEDRWLSVDEIGKYLGVSSDTVYRWIDKHALPAHRMGRLWKFKKDEVDEWVKAGGAADKSRQDQAE